MLSRIRDKRSATSMTGGNAIRATTRSWGLGLPNAAVVQRFSKPIPRPLYAIAEIAAALATGDSVGPVMPGILSAVASELEGTQSTLWLRARDGLRRAWSVGGD